MGKFSGSDLERGYLVEAEDKLTDRMGSGRPWGDTPWTILESVDAHSSLGLEQVGGGLWTLNRFVSGVTNRCAAGWLLSVPTDRGWV